MFGNDDDNGGGGGGGGVTVLVAFCFFFQNVCVCVCVCVCLCDEACKNRVLVCCQSAGPAGPGHPFNVNTRREPISYTGYGFSLSLEGWALGLEPRASPLPSR